MNMKAAVLVFLLVLIVGCNRVDERWPTRTGTSADPDTAHVVLASEDTKPGQFQVPQGYNFAGCLTGANQHFVLADANSGTIYRLQANYDELKMFVGELIAVQGNIVENQGGVPMFSLCSKDLEEGKCPAGSDTHPKMLAENCPSVALGGTNELNQPPATKVGLKQSVAEPNPRNIPGEPAFGHETNPDAKKP